MSSIPGHDPSRPPNLGLLLREPYRIANEELHTRIAARGHPEVRTAHGNVLQYLDAEGTSVSELARRAQVTKQSMAELVAHLESHGYVERVPDPADGRAKLVRATAKAGEVYEIVQEVIVEIDREWTQLLGKRKMAELTELLTELNEGMHAGRSEPP
jgi:DNA-binding MarR family transcriptional regulator